MDIEANNCNNCPFESSHTDDWDNDISICTLRKYYCRNTSEYVDSTISISGIGENDPDIDNCEYCQKYEDIYHDWIADGKLTPEPIYDESKCSCKELEEKWYKDNPIKPFKSPEWCPLNNECINVKLIDNE